MKRVEGVFLYALALSPSKGLLVSSEKVRCGGSRADYACTETRRFPLISGEIIKADDLLIAL